MSFNIFKNEYLVIALILIGLVIIFFNGPIFNNRTLVPFDILEEYDLSFESDGFQSNNYLLSDLVDQFYPNYYFLRESFNKGFLPLWNPYILGGIPFLADSQTGIFEFSHLFSYVLNIEVCDFFLFSALINIFLLGFFFYLYLRNLNFDKLISLFGTVVLMFSGTSIVWINYALFWAFVWFPLILLCIDKIILAKKYKFLPLLSGAVVFSLLAGYPQVTLIELILGGLYLIFKVFRFYKEDRTKILLWPVIFIGLSFLMVAFQLGPAWDFIKESNSYEVGRDYRLANGWQQDVREQFSHPLSSLEKVAEKIMGYGVLAFVPKYYGSPLERNYVYPENNPYANFSEVTIYIGLVGFILALASCLLVKRRVVIFWLATGVISFSLAVRLPFISLLGYLPLIDRMSLSRFRIFFVFAFVMLAVYGLQAVVRKINWKNINLKNIFIVVAIVLSFADLLYYFHDYNKGVDKGVGSISNNGAIKFLKNNLVGARFVGLGLPNKGFYTTILPNTPMLHGIEDIRGYNPIIGNEQMKLFDKYFTRRGSFVLADAVFEKKILDLMNIKYLVCPKGGCVFADKGDGLPIVYGDNRVIIQENKNLLPRSYVAYDFDSVKSIDEFMELFGAFNFDLNNKVAVAGEILGMDRVAGLGIKEVKIINYSQNKVVIEAESEQRGILVLVDNFDKGWKVIVNGIEEKPLRVNGLYRGVVIPSGKTEVVWFYRPVNFNIYLWLTFFGWLFFICTTIFILKKKALNDCEG